MSAFLELFDGGTTLADRMRHAARARVIVDVAKELQAEADLSLREAADVEQTRTGTAFTARNGGVTALVTDPQPKPKVTDRDAFAGWFAEAYPDDVEVRDHVTVVDTRRAVEGLQVFAKGDLPAAAELLADALSVSDEVLLPEKALDLAYDRGRLHVTDNTVIDVTTGEHVPGLGVSRAKPVLQVRLDKQARAAAQGEVRAALGIPAELGGGR